MALTTHTLLAPRLCMNGAVPLPPLCAFMACYRVTFTLSSLVNWWIFWFVPSLSSHFDTCWSKSGYGVDSVIVRTMLCYIMVVDTLVHLICSLLLGRIELKFWQVIFFLSLSSIFLSCLSTAVYISWVLSLCSHCFRCLRSWTTSSRGLSTLCH